MKNRNKWKDRGWWVSVEIDNRTSARKNEDLARELLGKAQEHYDLLLESGKSVSRGIFTADADLLGLARLLEIAGRWSNSKIYVSGDRLASRKIHQLTTLLNCAGNPACCRRGEKEQRLAFLGCHQMRIGLLNYSLASLKKGGRYWFSYLKSEKDDPLRVHLDKDRLKKDLASSQTCPLFPDIAKSIIETLPSTVGLKPINNQLFWMPTGRKIRTSWLCRFPPVVPCSAELYRSWLEKLLDSRLPGMTRNF